MAKRDQSPRAIRERYNQANLKAVMCSDSMTFNSLQDIFYLLTRLKECTSILALVRGMVCSSGCGCQHPDLCEAMIRYEKRAADLVPVKKDS